MSEQSDDEAREPDQPYIDPEVFRIELRYPGSWVRVTHLPTGLMAESRESEATQVENRDAALGQLREMLRERGIEPMF